MWYVESDRAAAFQELEVAANYAKLVDPLELRRFASRTVHPEPPQYRPDPDATTMELPAAVRGLTRRARKRAKDGALTPCASNPDVCGRSLPFGNVQLVYVADSCGSFCYWSCLFHDPAEDLWAVPPDTASWMTAAELREVGPCDSYRLDATSQWVLAELGNSAPEHHLCSMGGRCEPLAGVAHGWIDPGPMFVVEKTHGP